MVVWEATLSIILILILTASIMGKNKDPPKFDQDNKPYAQWKEEVELWQMSLPKEDSEPARNAIRIVLDLPNDGNDSLRERCIANVKLYTTTEDGSKEPDKDAYKNLMTFLDEEFKKNHILEISEKIDDWLETKKSESQSIKEFLNNFDFAYKKAKNIGLPDMPQEFLLTRMLKCANLEDRDYKFVVSQINTEEKTTLYKQGKDAMLKLFSSLRHKPGGAEPSTSETFFAGRGGFRGRGFRGGGFGGGGFRGRGSYGSYGRGFGGGNRGFHREPPENRATGIQNVNQYNDPRSHRKINPTQNGKILGCFNCGAMTHLVKNCPEKNLTLVCENEDEIAPLIQDPQFLNVHFLNQNQEPHEEETIVNFNTEVSEVDRLTDALRGISNEVDYVSYDCLYNADVMLTNRDLKEESDLPNVLTIDTGCVSTVSGKETIDRIIKAMPEKAKKLIKVSKSDKRFRFGGGEKRVSIGHFAIPLSIGDGHNIVLYTDVVEAPIPCLISMAAIKAAGGVINTNDDSITLFGRVRIKLTKVPAGHYGIPIKAFCFKDGQKDVQISHTNKDNQTSLSEEEWDVFQSEVEHDVWVELPDIEKDDKEEVIKKVKKIHDQLGHPAKPTFIKMLKLSSLMGDEQNGFLYDFINKLYESCSTCIQFSKSKPRPKVGPPLATRFNQTVSIDLKVWPKHNVIILYIADNFTRFMQAHIIPDKRPENVIKVLMDEWILKMFGAMEALQLDNGGEFMNEKMKEMCEKFGIKFLSSGASSPWQNGLIERNHMIVDQIVEKMKKDQPKKSVKELLPHAIFAKNCLVNVSGYIPLQLVFGVIPRLPGAPYNAPPANETLVQHEAIASRLQSLYSARQGYMEVENSARMKRALNSKIPPPQMINYQNGQQVFYKHLQTGGWHGPATVIGTANKVIYIKQGRFILATSQSRIIPEKRYNEASSAKSEHGDLHKNENDTASPHPSQATEQPVQRQSNGRKSSESDSGSDDDSPHPSAPTPTPPPTRPPQPAPHYPPQNENPNFENPNPNFQIQDNIEVQDLKENSPVQNQNVQPSPPRNHEAPTDAGNSPTQASRDETTLLDESLRSNSSLDEKLREMGQIGSKERYKRIKKAVEKAQKEDTDSDDDDIPPLPKFRRPGTKSKLTKGGEFWIREKALRHDDDAWYKVKMIQKTRKATKHGPPSRPQTGPYWTAMRMEDGELFGLYEWSFDFFREGEYMPDWIKNYVSVLDSDDDSGNEFEDMDITLVTFIHPKDYGTPRVKAAKIREHQNFIEFKAFREVDDVGQQWCSSSWVLTDKIMGNGEMGAKARIVVHGNQLDNNVDSDSPTVRKITLRVMICLAVQYRWRVSTADVTAAFLQSQVMLRTVHVKPPRDIRKDGKLWLLLKPMYGLQESGRCWYVTVDLYLTSLGGKKTTADPACWVFHHDGRFMGFFALHVDDALYAGTPRFHDTVMKSIFSKFKFGKLEEGDFKLLGWNMQTTKEGEISISQQDYAKAKLKRCDLKKPPTKQYRDPLDPKQTSQLRSLTGSLRWMADQTRPDVAFACLHLNCMANKPTWNEVIVYNDAVDQIKNNNFKTMFRRLKPDRWTISVFADASHGNLPPDFTGTGGGHIIFLGNRWTRVRDRNEETERKNRCNVISWKCTKLPQACESTTEAETIALSKAIVEADIIKEIIVEATKVNPDLIDIEAYCDSKNAVDNIRSKLISTKSQPYRHSTKKVRDFLDEGKMKNVLEINTEEQLADCLTKRKAGTSDIIQILSEGRFWC